LAHLACWPTGPTGLLAQQNHRPTQPTWLGLTSRLGSGSTDPARPLSLVYSPLTPELTGDPDRPCRRPAIPAASGDHHRRHLGRNMRPRVLYHSAEWIRQTPPPRGDRGGATPRDPPPPLASGWWLRRVSSLEWAEQPLLLALHKHLPVSVPSSSSLLLCFPSMAMLSDLLVKNIELSSQISLCDAV
jgi:hypothetical protein